MQDNKKLEEIAMLIIANSGAARSSSFGALEKAKKGNYEAADKLLKEADESLHTAHESHRELLKMDSKGEVEHMNVLLAHAQDHLMSSTLASELVKEIILLYKNKTRR